MTFTPTANLKEESRQNIKVCAKYAAFYYVGDSVNGRVVGSMIDYLHANDEAGNQAVLAQLCHGDTRIVSLTVTEKGYHYGTAIYQANNANDV